MNKRKVLQLTVLFLCLVLLGMTVWFFWLSSKNESQGEAHESTGAVQTQGNQDNTECTLSAGEEDSTTTDATQPVQQDTVPETRPEGPKDPTQTPTDSAAFPYSIPGTTLVITQVNAYDGIFLEDGSDKEINNVTAMVLTNTGDECIEYMDITIERDGTKLEFIGSALEPGGTGIILEANAKQFSKGNYSNCRAEIATLKDMEMSRNKVHVEENSDGGLLVKNVSGEDISCVRIFYKFYIFDKEVYLGGITYTAKVVDLKKGDSYVITPSHYFAGYSKIVMVKTYETDA